MGCAIQTLFMLYCKISNLYRRPVLSYRQSVRVQKVLWLYFMASLEKWSYWRFLTSKQIWCNETPNTIPSAEPRRLSQWVSTLVERSIMHAGPQKKRSRPMYNLCSEISVVLTHLWGLPLPAIFNHFQHCIRLVSHLCYGLDKIPWYLLFLSHGCP
jgi:hypothetical protein